MLNRILIFFLLLVPAHSFGGTAPVAQLMDTPPALINNSSPSITVGGDGVASYRYRINNGAYSDEIPVSDPMRFGADVTVQGHAFSSGSRELQNYLDRRVMIFESTDFIDSIELSNVSSDVNVTYTLNPKRVFLQEHNVFIAEGAGAGDLRPSVIRVTPLSAPGLHELFVRGGVLKFDQPNNPARMILEMPPGEKIVLSPTAGVDTVITVNGEVVTSGATIELPSLFDGASVNITCTTGSETLQYELVVKERAFDGQPAIGFYFRSKNPSSDYLSIPNNGVGPASVSFNLNGRLFADNDALVDTIRSLPEEYPGETIPRKIWRFIRDNRYHHYSVTGDTWGHNPTLLFNSIGFGLCDDVAAVYSQLATSLGFTSRVWSLFGHVVPEVFVDGRWELYDPDLIVYYYNDAGQIAGVEELAADPSLILSPRNRIASPASVAYGQYVADIYATTSNNVISPLYADNPLVDYNLFIDIPPAGRFEFPKRFVSPFLLTFDTTSNSYTNARVVVPRNWSGTVHSSLLILAIGNEGQNDLSVIARNDAGIWQTDPTTVSFRIDTIAPLVSVFQSSGYFNTAEPVQLSIKEPGVIYYTVDGSDPSSASTVYTAPFYIAPGSVIKYFAIDAAGNQGAIKSYFDPPPPVSQLDVAFDKESPQVIGATVTLTASASGGSGSYEYVFHLYNPHTKAWTRGQAYSANGTWLWDTSGLVPGSYSIQVWTRNVGSSVFYDTHKSFSYIIDPLPRASQLSVAIDKASPQVTGTTVTLTASASGGSGSYEYVFHLYNPNTKEFSVAQAYSANGTWIWDTSGLAPGSYSIQVWTRNAGSSVDKDTYKSFSYIIAPPPPASQLNVTFDKASPQITGTTVTLTAVASGGIGNYEYFFTFYNPNTKAWSTGQAYSANGSWRWDTSGLAPGSYSIQVWTRNAGSNVNYDTYKSYKYTIDPPPVSGLNIAIDKASPQVTGTTVTLTASASGGGGNYEYVFHLYNPNTRTWSVGQAYSGNGSWLWDTSGLAPGIYSIQVWTRNAGSSVNYDTHTNLKYTIDPPPPVSGLSVAIDKASPQVTGTAVTLTASASGGGGNYEYVFHLYNPNTKAWTIGQAYSGNGTWLWDTSGLAPGIYSIQVWTRNAGSSVNYDTHKNLKYTIEPPPVSGLSIAIDKASPQVTGTTVTLTASASGGGGNYEYAFYVYDPNTKAFSVGQAYSANGRLLWNTSGLAQGIYTIQVWTRNSGSSIDKDIYKSVDYTIDPPPVSGLSVAIDKASPQVTGTAVTLTASASGGGGNYEYVFHLYNPNTKAWSIGQGYSANGSWLWDTSGLAPGIYSIQVWTRNAGSSVNHDAYRSLKYTIEPPPVSGLSVAIDKASPQVTGATITLTASASGGGGNYEYAFYVYDPHTRAFSVGQGYSASGTWFWDTSGLAPGIYSIQVWTRNVGSNVNHDAYRSLKYTIEPPPVSGLSVAIDKASPQVTGATITLTASASGGGGIYEYAFYVYDPHTRAFSVGQLYGANGTWLWDTSGLAPGIYSIQVWTRNAGSSVNYDIYKSFKYTIEPPPVSGLSIAIDKASPQVAGTAVTLTASASGGGGNYEYAFHLYNPITRAWSMGQAYGANGRWLWDTSGLAPGIYSIQVWTRNAGSSVAYDTYKAFDYVIN